MWSFARVSVIVQLWPFVNVRPFVAVSGGRLAGPEANAWNVTRLEPVVPMHAVTTAPHETITRSRRSELAIPATVPTALRPEYAPIAVEATPVALGLANRHRIERMRRVRRLVRALGMPLLVSVAVVSGLAVGRIGDRMPPLRVIAPTTLPVTAPSRPVAERPLALMPTPRTGT